MGCIVTGVDGDGLVVRDRAGTTRYAAGTVLWTAGVEAPPVVAAARRGHRRADRTARAGPSSGHDLTVPGHPEISVIGDAMSLDELPGVAEVAMQCGLLHRTADPAAAAAGGPARPFRYHDLGSAAYISRGAARSSRPGRSTWRASPAGWRGCSSTSPSSPGTATGSAPS